MVFFVFLLVFISKSSADVIHASATMGTAGQTSGASLNDSQYLGSRFYVDQDVVVTTIGGHMNEFGGGNFFGAIERLTSASDFPNGSPFNGTDQFLDPNSTSFRWDRLDNSWRENYVVKPTRFVVEGSFDPNVAPVTYCSASGGCDEYISRVQVGTIDNSSGCGTDGYTDYISLSTEMESGFDYMITVINGSTYNGDQCGVWVDWNQDGVFTNPNEQILVSGGPGTFTGMISPPIDAVIGDTRMRVRVTYTGTVSPCDHTLYGEVEDYTITVIGVGLLSVSGRTVATNGVGIPNVLISANSGETTSSDLDGNYNLVLPGDWTGSVTAEKSQWVFDPNVYVFGGTPGNHPNTDFEGTYIGIVEPTVSGYVQKGNGDGVANVLISASSGESITTYVDGYYELTLLSQGASSWNGTITPSKADWEFVPTSILYTDLILDITDQNYTATYVGNPTPVISGHVRDGSGVGIEDVWVYTDDFVGYSGMTDASGYYEIIVAGPWDGMLTALKTDWAFEPNGINIVELGDDLSGQDFTGNFVGVGCDGLVVEEWTDRYDGRWPEYYIDQVTEIAIDPVGNIYLSGESVSEDTSYDYATLKYAPDSSDPLWIARYNGPGNSWDYVRGLVVDPEGNVYITGESRGSTTVIDYATIKYDTHGTELWVARYDGPDSLTDEAEAIFVDDVGNVYVTGTSNSSSGSYDYCTIKYNPNGIELWDACYNGLDNDYDNAKAIIGDDQGNVYVTGYSYEGGDFNYVTVKYDPNGIEKWVARYDGPDSDKDWARAIALDEENNIYVTGESHSIATEDDYCTIKYDPNGKEIWVKTYDGPDHGEDFPWSMVVRDNTIYIAGSSEKNGYLDYCIVKYDLEGNELWVAHHDGTEQLDDFCASITLDDLGNIYVTGSSNYVRMQPNAAIPEIVTIKYRPDSPSPVWLKQYSGKPGIYNVGSDIVVGHLRNIYVGGYDYGYLTIKYSQCYPDGDMDIDFDVDVADLGILGDEWLLGLLGYDVWPEERDGVVNWHDFAMLSSGVSTGEVGMFVSEWLKPGAVHDDIAPNDGDGFFDLFDFSVVSANWMAGS